MSNDRVTHHDPLVSQLPDNSKKPRHTVYSNTRCNNCHQWCNFCLIDINEEFSNPVTIPPTESFLPLYEDKLTQLITSILILGTVILIAKN